MLLSCVHFTKSQIIIYVLIIGIYILEILAYIYIKSINQINNQTYHYLLII